MAEEKEYGITCIPQNSSLVNFTDNKDYFYDAYTFGLLSYGYLRQNGVNPTDIASVLLTYVGNDECSFEYTKTNGGSVLFYNPNNRVIGINLILDDNNREIDIDRDIISAHYGIFGFRLPNTIYKDKKSIKDIKNKIIQLIKLKSEEAPYISILRVIKQNTDFFAEIECNINAYFLRFDRESCDFVTLFIDSIDNKKRNKSKESKNIEIGKVLPRILRVGLKAGITGYDSQFSVSANESILISIDKEKGVLSFYKNRLSDYTIIGRDLDDLTKNYPHFNNGKIPIDRKFEYIPFHRCSMNRKFELESIRKKNKPL